MDNHRRSHSLNRESRMDMELVDGTSLSDYHTAHNRAGDPSYQTFLPEACVKCFRQAQIAQDAGLEVPTSPDEEIG